MPNEGLKASVYMVASGDAADYSSKGGKGNKAFGQTVGVHHCAGYQPPGVAGEGEQTEIAERGDEKKEDRPEEKRVRPAWSGAAHGALGQQRRRRLRGPWRDGRRACHGNYFGCLLR